MGKRQACVYVFNLCFSMEMIEHILQKATQFSKSGFNAKCHQYELNDIFFTILSIKITSNRNRAFVLLLCVRNVSRSIQWRIYELAATDAEDDDDGD